MQDDKYYDSIPWIEEVYSKLLYETNCLDDRAKKKYIKDLDIIHKAIYYGANPKNNYFEEEEYLEKYGHVNTIKDISKESAKEVYEFALHKLKDDEFEEKMKKQRYERGYSDSDVMNYYNWFIKISSKMLKELADNSMGYPSEIDRQYFKKNKQNLYTQKYDEWVSVSETKRQQKQKEKASEICHKEWTDILNRMIFLLNEMDENTCSMAEEADVLFEACSKIDNEFTQQYGICGSELKKTLKVKDVWTVKKYRENVMKDLRKKKSRKIAKRKNIKISENMTIHDMEQIIPGCLMLNPSYLPKNN